MRTRRARQLHNFSNDPRVKRAQEQRSTARPPAENKGLVDSIRHSWKLCEDLQVQQLRVHGRVITLFWVRSLAESDALRTGVVDPLTKLNSSQLSASAIASELFVAPVHTEVDIDHLNSALADGNTVIVIEGDKEAVVAQTSQPPRLSIERPQNEPSVAGPQEAFVGSLDTDIAMIRKRLKDPGLKVESLRLGTRSHTSVALLYFDGIINPDLVSTVKERINRIQVDHVLSTNYIREVIRDHRYSLFPTMDVSERPDKIAAGLVEGRFSILVDGTPQATMAPCTFLSYLTAAEDYYQSFALSILVRTIRQIGFWTALLLPGIYIAILSFNQDLVPTPLLISIAQQHAGIPLPTMIEMFLMVFAFEVLREAGIRLPKAIGQSVSIVGALVIGEASVDAGIVSSGAVIIVAVAGVASFTIPSVELVNTIRLLQFVFMLGASLFGIYGIVILGFCLILFMTYTESFGVPYMAPYAPLSATDMKDAAIRAPWWMMRSRPQQLHPSNPVRNRTQPPT